VVVTGPLLVTCFGRPLAGTTAGDPSAWSTTGPASAETRSIAATSADVRNAPPGPRPATSGDLALTPMNPSTSLTMAVGVVLPPHDRWPLPLPSDMSTGRLRDGSVSQPGPTLPGVLASMLMCNWSPLPKRCFWLTLSSRYFRSSSIRARRSLPLTDPSREVTSSGTVSSRTHVPGSTSNRRRSKRIGAIVLPDGPRRLSLCRVGGAESRCSCQVDGETKGAFSGAAPPSSPRW
jgi:hypothetical protein